MIKQGEIDKLDKQWWGVVEHGGFLGAMLLLARYPLPPKVVFHQIEMNRVMSGLVYRGHR